MSAVLQQQYDQVSYDQGCREVSALLQHVPGGVTRGACFVAGRMLGMLYGGESCVSRWALDALLATMREALYEPLH